MNKIFTEKNTDKIVLDEKYSLQPDGFKGLVLVFEEPRIRVKKDKTEEEYLFQDQWYHAKLSQTLSKYLMLTTNEAKSIEELRDIVLRVEQTIKDKLI
jgi:hypothetical protein